MLIKLTTDLTETLAGRTLKFPFSHKFRLSLPFSVKLIFEIASPILVSGVDLRFVSLFVEQDGLGADFDRGHVEVGTEKD